MVNKHYALDRYEILTKLDRKVSFLDFWCHPGAAKVTVTNSAADLDFPDIVVSGLPSGLTLIAVHFVLAIANLKDTSAAANYINAASKSLRLKPDAGTWLANSVIGLTLDQNSLYVSASGERGGPVLFGPDIKTNISADGTYNVRSEETNHGDAIVAAGADLELHDVDVGLRFYFK